LIQQIRRMGLGRDPDNMELFASHRNLCLALVMLLPCVFWNSFVSVILVVVILNTLHVLGVMQRADAVSIGQ
jgi:hypothetical protein